MLQDGWVALKSVSRSGSCMGPWQGSAVRSRRGVAGASDRVEDSRRIADGGLGRLPVREIEQRDRHVIRSGMPQHR